MVGWGGGLGSPLTACPPALSLLQEIEGIPGAREELDRMVEELDWSKQT